jgi:hypothetical protein
MSTVGSKLEALRRTRERTEARLASLDRRMALMRAMRGPVCGYRNSVGKKCKSGVRGFHFDTETGEKKFHCYQHDPVVWATITDGMEVTLSKKLAVGCLEITARRGLSAATVAGLMASIVNRAKQLTKNPIYLRNYLRRRR